jgi:hypothetical protein
MPLGRSPRPVVDPSGAHPDDKFIDDLPVA